MENKTQFILGLTAGAGAMLFGCGVYIHSFFYYQSALSPKEMAAAVKEASIPDVDDKPASPTKAETKAADTTNQLSIQHQNLSDINFDVYVVEDATRANTCYVARQSGFGPGVSCVNAK